MIKTILIAYDGSSSRRRRLISGCKWQLYKAKLIVVSVVQLPEPAMIYETTALVDEANAHYEQELPACWPPPVPSACRSKRKSPSDISPTGSSSRRPTSRPDRDGASRQDHDRALAAGFGLTRDQLCTLFRAGRAVRCSGRAVVICPWRRTSTSRKSERSGRQNRPDHLHGHAVFSQDRVVKGAVGHLARFDQLAVKRGIAIPRSYTPPGTTGCNRGRRNGVPRLPRSCGRNRRGRRDNQCTPAATSLPDESRARR